MDAALSDREHERGWRRRRSELLPSSNEREQDLLRHVLGSRETARPRDAVGNETWRQRLKGFAKVHKGEEPEGEDK